eukprot:CAMPEP_0206154710 /NCGR_PEP_ID=MMETSP1474-20131121/1605_1 /ASSEMBLY_ACC=CAM_ASM_001110 /TAXON_ID=97495 /ORGANISM="Imantonia sp., Strain RCC918" /LENGTH=81 /DNA_ID=CAMNT_0053553073 /DNA_START=65 /DNA_END=310 /DNA_ORIENTATION=+
MARSNRRDCRVGARKKREKNRQADDQIKAIRKERKAGGAKAGTAASAGEPITAASSDFLVKMRAEVKRKLEASKAAATHAL